MRSHPLVFFILCEARTLVRAVGVTMSYYHEFTKKARKIYFFYDISRYAAQKTAPGGRGSCGSVLLAQILRPAQAGIEAAAAHQLVMRALLADPAVRDHDDA